MIPSITQIGRAAEDIFVMEDWHNLGPHYEKTLLAWHDNFQKVWEGQSTKYDLRFNGCGSIIFSPVPAPSVPARYSYGKLFSPSGA